MSGKTIPVAFKKSESWKMFNDISSKYDLLNHLLSFGLDNRWRKILSKFLVEREKTSVIDLATGTADVLLSFFKNTSFVKRGFGIDLADKMLDIARKKVTKRGLEDMILLKHGDANEVPFDDRQFDNVTISFGIRNVEVPSNVLKEMYRVLNPNGRALILEFSMPRNSIMRAGNLFYLRTVVPIIGGLISGNFKAYRYLNQTIEAFPYGDDFCTLMKEQGFKNVKANQLLFGVATIYQGDKPS